MENRPMEDPVMEHPEMAESDPDYPPLPKRERLFSFLDVLRNVGTGRGYDGSDVVHIGKLYALRHRCLVIHMEAETQTATPFRDDLSSEYYPVIFASQSGFAQFGDASPTSE